MSSRKSVQVDRGWQLVLKDIGVDSQNVLRRAGLPEDLLSQENARITSEDYFRFWDGITAEAKDPALPIRVAERVSPEAFHPAIFAALCSKNLTVAFGRIAKYKKLLAPVMLDIIERPNGLFIGPRWEDPNLKIPDTVALVELSVLTQIARTGTRARLVPIKVESPVPMQPEGKYEAFFGVKPTLAKEHGVTFSFQDALRPFLTASESLWQTFEPELRRRLANLDSSASVSERVRSVLLESLPSGQASIDDTASRLGSSLRTLQRWLRAEGTSFKQVLQDTRQELALHYLHNTNLTYNEIAFLLGFEEPNSFFRAFRKWTGKTPESVRFATV